MSNIIIQDVNFNRNSFFDLRRDRLCGLKGRFGVYVFHNKIEPSMSEDLEIRKLRIEIYVIAFNSILQEVVVEFRFQRIGWKETKHSVIITF